jgi:hypothetical protein
MVPMQAVNIIIIEHSRSFLPTFRQPMCHMTKENIFKL